MTVPEFLPSKTNLQSKNGLDVLDTISSLRSQGVGQYVDLPQIIVCGDQSSGKSSVLEALSGMAFPTKDALCTRLATEIILRRSVDKRETTLAVSIIPGPNRSDVERRSLDEFRTEGEAVFYHPVSHGVDGRPGHRVGLLHRDPQRRSIGPVAATSHSG